MRRWSSAAFVAVLAVAACRPQGNVNNPNFAVAGEKRDAIAVYEELERLIDAQKATKQDREDAYALISGWDDDGSADYAFARAAIAGRLAENRGLQAGGLVTEAESYARRAREKEPDYREGSATRLLGTLYVLAPARLLKHGDSEAGLELLEVEVKAHPERLISRLRLAEAYIALGDPDPAKEHLCVCKQGEANLGAGDRRLLAKLVEDAGGEDELKCAAPAEAAAAAG